jgi:hypothetical protein
MSTLNLSRTARGGFEDRAEVKEVAQRKKELRESLRSAQSQVDEARLAFADGRVEARELAEASNHRDSVKMQLDDAEQGHAALLGRLAGGPVVVMTSIRPLRSASRCRILRGRRGCAVCRRRPRSFR